MSGHTKEWNRFNEKSPIRKETITDFKDELNFHLIHDIEDGVRDMSDETFAVLLNRCQ